MKFNFLSDSDEEAILEFVKQNAELYDKTHMKFKYKQRKGDSGKDYQLLGLYLSTPSRSGSRLNIPNMASSLT